MTSLSIENAGSHTFKSPRAHTRSNLVVYALLLQTRRSTNELIGRAVNRILRRLHSPCVLQIDDICISVTYEHTISNSPASADTSLRDKRLAETTQNVKRKLPGYNGSALPLPWGSRGKVAAVLAMLPHWTWLLCLRDHQLCSGTNSEGLYFRPVRQEAGPRRKVWCGHLMSTRQCGNFS